MTNRIALVLGLLILGGMALDGYFYNWTNTLFMARKFTDLIEYLAFWR